GLAALTASGHAVIYKRDSRSAAIWVLVIWILPALGPVAYALLGVNRVERRAARMRGGMVRHRTDPQFPPSEPGTHFTPLAQLGGEAAAQARRQRRGVQPAARARAPACAQPAQPPQDPGGRRRARLHRRPERRLPLLEARGAGPGVPRSALPPARAGGGAADG